MEAFAQAMIDALTHPEREVFFNMQAVGGPTIPCSARDFLSLRPQEEDIIKQSLSSLEAPRILDIGCCVGRHLRFIQGIKAQSHLHGVEINATLRNICAEALPNATLVKQLGDIPDQHKFHLILLMGNGLGIFGSEQSTRNGLRRIHALLAQDGSLLLESGNPFRQNFTEIKHYIEYCGLIDDPFLWGYASENWVCRELEDAGFVVRAICQISRPGPFFIFYARHHSSP